MRPHIGGEKIHAERDVAHERHAARARVMLRLAPLLIGDPLYILAKADAALEGAALGARQSREPCARGVGIAMLERPRVPALRTVALHEHAEEHVAVEPRSFGAAKFAEAPCPRATSAPRVREEIFIRPLEQRRLERLHRGILHRPGAHGIGREFREVAGAQVGHRRGRHLDRRGIERDGRDRIVGRMIAARFIHRQQLHEMKTLRRRPIHKLAQRPHVAHAEIVRAPQRKERREQSGDFLFRR